MPSRRRRSGFSPSAPRSTGWSRLASASSTNRSSRERGFSAEVYYQTLVVTAMTALAGNFLGGWLAVRVPLTTAAWPIALFVPASLGAGGAAARVDDRAGDGVGHGDGTRRRPGDGAVLQRVPRALRPRASRPHSGRGAGDDRASPRRSVRCCSPGAWSRTGSYAAMFRLLAGVIALVAVAAQVAPLPLCQRLRSRLP